MISEERKTKISNLGDERLEKKRKLSEKKKVTIT